MLVPSASVTQAVADHVQSAIGSHGLPAVFVLMALESACIPVPSEVIQVFAGYLVSKGSLGFVEAVLAGTLGNLAGSCVAWFVGVRGGRRLVDRYGSYLHVTPKRMALADRWFAAHGPAVVFWARMLPVVRTFISLPAGIARMPLRQFALYTFCGALPWCTLLTAAGWWAGTHWHAVERYLHFVDYAVAAGIVVGAAILVRRLTAARGRLGEPDDEGSTP